MHLPSPRDAQSGLVENMEGAWTIGISTLKSLPRDLAALSTYPANIKRMFEHCPQQTAPTEEAVCSQLLC